MPGLTIEDFKNQLAEVEQQIVSESRNSPSLCKCCQPVAHRLEEVVRAHGDGFYGGSRDSCSNISVGTLEHILGNTNCPLCGLLTRLVFRLKETELFEKLKGIDRGCLSMEVLQNTLLEPPIADNLSSVSSSSEDSSLYGDIGNAEDGIWIVEKYGGRFQVSVDAITHSGAMSVWLPEDESPEINDEESQLFMNPQEYKEIFGKAPTDVMVPRASNRSSRNLKQLQDCYTFCNTHHSDCRRSGSSEIPARLVDIEEMRVVEVPKGKILHYVALSYVWGTTPFITLTSINAELLQTSGSLQESFIALPKTISDAVEVAKRFGFRYVWIDSLCIKQDDRHDQAGEIQRMHHIYANADLTIVAATGSSAQASLIDIDETRLMNFYHTIGDQNFCLDRPEFQNLVRSTTWFTRGWTLQELNCSPRIIYFLPERTYYSCSMGSWNEDFPWDGNEPVQLSRNLHDPDPKGASFSGNRTVSNCYVAMVEGVCQRQFTNDGDVLRAMIGMYKMFALDTFGPAVAGLPTGILEAGLLWQQDGRLERRNAKYPDQPQPTWSWAGWKGPVTYPISNFENSTLQPLIEWTLYLRVPGKDRKEIYSRVSLAAFNTSEIGSYITCWRKESHDGANMTSALDNTGITLDHSDHTLPITDTFILENALLCCYSRTITVDIQKIAGPTLPERAGVLFFSILDSEKVHTIGELKVDIDTLQESFGLDVIPCTAELLPIANLNFSSASANHAVHMSRYSRVGHFSRKFLDLLDQDVEMTVALWIVRQGSTARRISLGYLAQSGLAGCAFHERLIVLT